MEPNKLEQDIKKKLEQRTIQPSDMAWDRLDAMLSVTEKKKPNRAWMYMAASFVALLLVGALFLRQEKENNGVIKTEDAVVTVEQPTEPADTQKEVQSGIQDNEETVVTAIVNQKAVATTTHKREKSTVLKKAVIAPTTVVVDTDGLVITVKKEPTIIQSTVEAKNLMAAATQQEVVKGKSKVKVDPNSLLSSVEGELTDSYRNKTFQGVVKNFNAVKTAVANRNYE